VCGQPIAADDPHGRCPECLSTVPPVSAEESLSEGAPPGSEEGLLADGQLFGGYRIVRRLGGGGMGDVYEAEHRETGRVLALKLLKSSLARVGAGQNPANISIDRVFHRSPT